MIGIIYQIKKGLRESLLLYILSEYGKLSKINLPGIIKSKRRSSMFFVQGTIWDFTLPHKKSKIVIPKETRLLYTPVNTKSSYEDLCKVDSLLKPLETLWLGESYTFIYDILFQVLKEWSSLDALEKEMRINYFYVKILTLLGHLPLNEVMLTNKQNYRAFFLGYGLVDSHLEQYASVYQESYISMRWLLSGIKLKSCVEESGNNTIYRNRIIQFLNMK